MFHRNMWTLYMNLCKAVTLLTTNKLTSPNQNLRVITALLAIIYHTIMGIFNSYSVLGIIYISYNVFIIL